MKGRLTIILILFHFIVSAQTEYDYISNGNDLYRLGKFDQAEMLYRQAVSLNPKNLTARYNLANALMQEKKYKEAVGLYEEISGGAPKQAKEVAYYNAGVGYTKQKELESSIEAYKNALRIDPDDRQARENLQKALSELKKKNDEKQNQKNQQSKMNPKEAEDKLKQLEQKEREVQKRLQSQAKGKGANGQKDW